VIEPLFQRSCTCVIEPLFIPCFH